MADTTINAEAAETAEKDKTFHEADNRPSEDPERATAASGSGPEEMPTKRIVAEAKIRSVSDGNERGWGPARTR